MAKPRTEEDLTLYLSVSKHAVSSVLFLDERAAQNPSTMSARIQDAETRYSEIEKLPLALVVAARKLKPYFQAHVILVLTNHPLH